MENTYPRRLQSHTATSRHPSPGPDRLLRSRSGSSSSQAMNNLLYTASPSQRFITAPRSKSNAKSRSEDKTVISSMKKMGQENREGNSIYSNNVTFASPKLRGSTSPSMTPRPSNFGSTTKGRKSSTSPSAWALSPGRTLPFAVGPEAVAANATRPNKVKSSGGGVGGVLKYFKLQKKGVSIQEEEFHQFRVMYNRLLQWRFANARAKGTMVTSHKVSQDKMFSVWLRISKMRNYVLDKRLQVEKLKHQIKVYQILHPQISLLNEWGKLEKKNIESVSRVVRKLSGVSNTIPLVDIAKGDAASIHEAMITAMDVMAGIQSTVTKLLPHLEKLHYMVTELQIMQKQQRELEKYITSVVGLMNDETSVRVQLIQVAREGESPTSPRVEELQCPTSMCSSPSSSTTDYCGFKWNLLSNLVSCALGSLDIESFLDNPARELAELQSLLG